MLYNVPKLTDIRANAPRTKRAARAALSHHFKTFAPDAQCYLTPRIHLCEMHHFSLGAWVQALVDRIIDRKSLLVHADSHDDLGHAPNVPLPGSFLSHAKERNDKQLSEDARMFVEALSKKSADPASSFIVPALAMGLFDRMINVYEGEYPQKDGRIYFEIEDVAGERHLIESFVRLEDCGKAGIPWVRVKMASFREQVEGFAGRSVLDLDLDYFNFARGNLKGAVKEFCEKVLVSLKPDFMTIALSRKDSFYDISKQPKMIENILAFCFKNKMLID